jgi:hypothetical protein
MPGWRNAVAPKSSHFEVKESERLRKLQRDIFDGLESKIVLVILI